MVANVQTMAYVGARPWHGLGVEVPANVTAAEMLVKAGLDWEVELVDLATVDTAVKVTHKAIRRKDNGQIIGVGGPSWRPMQNRPAFEILNSMICEGQVQWHTAGALGNGEKVWALVKLPGALEPVKGDVVEKFLLWVNGHSGGFAQRMMKTPIRVVCQNTLNAALSELFVTTSSGKISSKVKEGKEGEAISIRHIGDQSKKLEEGARALGLALKYYDEVGQAFGRMGEVRLSKAAISAVLDKVFPVKTEEQREREIGNARIQKSVLELAETGKGTDIVGVRGTAWGLYNAITEYVDHNRTTRGEDETEKRAARLESQWFGSGAKVKQEAFAEIMAAIN